jgi:preprotein translocase subunit SecG
MFTFLVVLIAIIALIMTLIVLLQSGRGGGLAGIAAGGATQQLLGARTAPDILEKATWTLGALFIVLCILTNFFIGGEEAGQSVIQQGQATEQLPPTLPPVDAQSLPSNDGGAAADPDASTDPGN